MKYLTDPLSVAYLVGGVFVLIILIRTRRIWRALITSAAGGLAALGIVNLSGLLTGVTLPVSIFSLGISCVLGPAGVISLLLLRVFW